MEKKIEFEVLGKPVGKGRPRFRNAGKFVQTYTPEKTAVFENLVRLSFQQAGGVKLNGALQMIIFAGFPIPKSVSKKRREAILSGEDQYTHKPDADNVAKAVCDALNGLAYDDDSQIVELVVQKAYSETPRTRVYIREKKRRSFIFDLVRGVLRGARARTADCATARGEAGCNKLQRPYF